MHRHKKFFSLFGFLFFFFFFVCLFVLFLWVIIINFYAVIGRFDLTSFLEKSNSFIWFQYPDYVDAYLRLAAIAKALNNVQLSIELVVPPLTALL